jgi:hypothetical protein
LSRGARFQRPIFRVDGGKPLAPAEIGSELAHDQPTTDDAADGALISLRSRGCRLRGNRSRDAVRDAAGKRERRGNGNCWKFHRGIKPLEPPEDAPRL